MGLCAAAAHAEPGECLKLRHSLRFCGRWHGPLRQWPIDYRCQRPSSEIGRSPSATISTNRPPGMAFSTSSGRTLAGREVEQRRIPLTLARTSRHRFLSISGAPLTVKNRVVARLRLDGDPSAHEAIASFIAAPPDDPWRDYQIIMWQGQTAGRIRQVEAVGHYGWHADRGRLSARTAPIRLTSSMLYSIKICAFIWKTSRQIFIRPIIDGPRSAGQLEFSRGRETASATIPAISGPLSASRAFPIPNGWRWCKAG